MGRWMLLLPAFALCATPEFRVETKAVKGGSELVTVFGRDAGDGGEVPLISVLRDTLGS